MQDEDFDALLGWLRERLGRQLTVSMQVRAGNVSLLADGALSESDGAITAIDPAPGRRAAFRIGEARLILFEGELARVEFDEPENVSIPDFTVTLPARATATFAQVEILFGDWGGNG